MRKFFLGGFILKQKILILIICIICVTLLPACSTDSISEDTSTNTTETINTKTVKSTPVPKKEMTEQEKMIENICSLFNENLAFDTGSYAMGEIPKGEYAFIGINSSKYYSEEDSAGNIIDNENFQSFGYVYVHGIGNIETRGVLVNVEAFEKLGVSGAKEIYEIITNQSNYLQSGMYKIGVDIPAGVYTVESIGSGYYATLTGPVGNNNIINNDNFSGKRSVSTSNGQYLELSRAMISE